MHDIQARYNRHKLNMMICSCGEYRYYERGEMLASAAERHARHNQPSEVTSYDNDEPRVEFGQRAHPGRNAGGVNSNSGDMGGRN